MNWFWQLNLIRFFEFYLSMIFVVGTAFRIHQYLTVLRLVRAVPGRWPRLFAVIKQHRMVFLTWATMGPGLAALFLILINSIACHLIWPQANLTPDDLSKHLLAVPIIVVLGVAMAGLDLYGARNVKEIDHVLMEKYFDQAEYWLKPWTAPTVRLLTFGFVNPRHMVRVEVRKALVLVSKMLSTTFWWVAGQTGLRIAFGLSLWLTFALAGCTQPA